MFAFSRSTTNTDITSRKAVRAALATAFEETGRIDYVIVTAGMLSIAPLNETKRRDLRRTLDVNLAAPAKIAQEAYGYLEQTAGPAGVLHVELLHPRSRRLQPLLGRRRPAS